MVSNSFFKYLDQNGARLTLQNRTFRHAKPSSFNDSEDLTIAGVFPDLEQALAELPIAFLSILASNPNTTPTCHSPMREKVQELQNIIRSNPNFLDLIKTDFERDPVYGGGDHYRELAAHHVQEINELMQSYRVLCVTTTCDSVELWERYAQDHQGIVLKIEPNLEKDSKFKLFRPVEYRDHRPPLYENVEEFVYNSLFGDKEKIYKEMSDKIIFTKTLEWSGENEYRLAIPIINEPAWDTLPYHPEELTALYFGTEINKPEIEEITKLAISVNPNIEFYKMENQNNGHLCFIPYK